MAFIYNLTDTWNSGATTFAGIKMAVTNTASGASSKLLDLTVSGSTTGSFSVDRSGNGALSGALTLGSPLGVASGGTGVASLTAGYIPFGNGTSAFGSSASLFWDSANARLGVGTTSPVARLHAFRSTDGIVAQFNGTVANLSYAEYTGASFFWNTNANISFGTSSAHALILGTNNTERMRIDSAGRLGFGNAPGSTSSFRIGRIITGGTTAYGIYSDGAVQTDVTTAAINYFSIPAAASGATISNLYSFQAAQGTITGATITNQYGFAVANSLTGATNNYGFYSDIASNTGRWNFYANGTAANYFAGNTAIGTTSFGTSADKVLALGTGTAPTTGPADTIQIYSTDLSVGNTMLSLFTEGTPVNVNATAAATHRIAIRVNGTVYYLLANTSA